MTVKSTGPLRVAMIGDRGIPARYSGFSTLVEEVSTRLVADHGIDVTVYCRRQYFDAHPEQYKGVKLVYLHAPGGKSFESLLHSARAIVHAVWTKFDAILVVDPGNSPLTLPMIAARVPFAIHTDGKGWQRSKWKPLQRKYYKWAEWWSARLATWLVTDSPAMGDYYLSEYAAQSSYIPYGSQVGGAPDSQVLEDLGLEPGGYHLVVARLEPENNVDWILREYRGSAARLPLVYVGNARYESDWSRALLNSGDGRVKCVGAIYEPERLNGLYRHCRTYLHGHEVGGTNPSLLRAMGAKAACVPIDVVYHREVLGDQGRYFAKTPGCLEKIIAELEANDDEIRRLSRLSEERAQTCYRWDAVAAAYATLFRELAASKHANTPVAAKLAANIYFPERFLRATNSDRPEGNE
jgi:glycosyltransferase involved in cell wall biosynthesis